MQTQPQPQSQSLMLRPLRRRSKWQQWIMSPTGFVDALKDGIAWIAIAVVLRLGVSWLIATLPMLWPIAALIVMAPALCAAYLSAQFPRLSLILGYRSLLVLLGLLLGGKL